jgi:hypothetical protein
MGDGNIELRTKISFKVILFSGESIPCSGNMWQRKKESWKAPYGFGA